MTDPMTDPTPDHRTVPMSTAESTTEDTASLPPERVEPDAPSGRHPAVVSHLVLGVAFLGMLLVWSLVEGGVVDSDRLGLLLPVPWLLAGVAGLAALVASDHRRSRRGHGEGAA